MNRIRRRLGATAALAGAALALSSPARGAPTAEELEACIRANEPEESSVQTVLMRTRDRADQVSESRAKIYWKRFDDGLSRVMLRMTDPPTQRDSAVLMIEKKDAKADLFMYLPELRRVRRVTTRMVSGSLFGTDFSYEDFERLQGYARDQVSEIRGPEDRDGRSVLVVESRPATDAGSAYERSVTVLDAETCVALESSFYEQGDEPRKVLRADPAKIEERDGRHFPRQVTMTDLRDGTSTEVVAEELEVDVSIPRKMFSQRELESGAR